MARPSNRAEQRRAIAAAFERALAEHGLGGATIAKVADEAGVAPGLVHHHFVDREDLVGELLEGLFARFRAELGPEGPADPDAARRHLERYVDATLALGRPRGVVAARALVGLFAEAMRTRAIARRLGHRLGRELDGLERCFRRLGFPRAEAERRAAGLFSAILGCLVFGALLPGKASGFAAPFVRSVVLAAALDRRPPSGRS